MEGVGFIRAVIVAMVCGDDGDDDDGSGGV